MLRFLADENFNKGKNNVSGEFRDEPELSRCDDQAFDSLKEAQAYVESLRDRLCRFVVFLTINSETENLASKG